MNLIYFKNLQATAACICVIEYLIYIYDLKKQKKTILHVLINQFTVLHLLYRLSDDFADHIVKPSAKLYLKIFTARFFFLQSISLTNAYTYVCAYKWCNYHQYGNIWNAYKSVHEMGTGWFIPICHRLIGVVWLPFEPFILDLFFNCAHSDRSKYPHPQKKKFEKKNNIKLHRW